MLEEQTKGSWFMITVSWEKGADTDSIAVGKFHQVYMYLNVRAPDDPRMDEAGNKRKRDQAVEAYNGTYSKDPYNDPIGTNDPVFDIVVGSIKALNLIGRRRFVIIFQTPFNRVLQRLSKMISLYTNINVEIFPATYVTELREIIPEKEILTSS